MKLTPIALAAAALMAGSAHAAITPTFIIYMDGATAVKNSVTDVAKAMCVDAAHTQVYQGGPSNKIVGVYCDGVNTANSGLAAATKLWIVKNSVDGSFEAFGRAILRQAQTTVLDETTCQTPTFSGTLTCSGTKLVDANGGFSDVEGTIWQGRGQFTPGGVAYTTKAGFAGQGFALAVTDKLYLALQGAQGLAVGLPAVPTAYTAADLANQPSITKQQFSSIVNGAGAYHNDWTPILGAAGTGMNMDLCRRVNVSGTEASMEVYFLNNPCANANPTFGQQNVTVDADSTTTFKVIENSGTGDMLKCLNAHNDDVVNAAVKADGTAADEFAIGFMSLENFPGKDTTNDPLGHWKFVKLDGVSPTPDGSQRQTVIDGKYNYAFESVFVYRNDNTTAQKNFMNKFIALMGDPSKVNPLVGIFSVPGAKDYFTFPTRVHRGTTGGNSCSPFSLTE